MKMSFFKKCAFKKGSVREGSVRVSVCLMVFIIGFITVMSQSFAEENNKMHWKKPNVDLSDLPSLQRGFKLFMNHCSGCHGIKYVRYNNVAKEIGIVDNEGKVLEEELKKNLLFVGDKITDNISTSMQKEEGANWFGIAPPDLSLEIRVRGADWVYNYLLSFYPDPKKIWGVNNSVYPDVAMPDVLANMKSRMTEPEFEQAVHDIVNFLTYVAEPMQLKRRHMGIWVLVFLGLLTVLAVLLKREYWKDVKD